MAGDHSNVLKLVPALHAGVPVRETSPNRLCILRQHRKKAAKRDPGVIKSLKWSEREDLNLRPLVSQTSALTGLRHAPMPFH